MSKSRPSQEMLYRYSQRKLSDDEEELVEIWLMENPDDLETVRADSALAQSLIGGNSTFKVAGLFRRGHWLHGIAYLTLCVALLVAVMPKSGTRQSEPSPARILQLTSLRSADKVVEFLLDSSREDSLIIAVPVGYLASGTFGASLQMENRQIAQFDNLLPENDQIMIVMPSKLLAPGEYRLTFWNNKTRAEQTVRWVITYQ